jgi:hypothetical protein
VRRRSRSSLSQGRRRPSRSRPWSSRRRRVGAGPAGDGAVLLYFPYLEPNHSRPYFTLVTTVSPLRPEAQGEPHHPRHCTRTGSSSRGRNEPGVLVGPCVPAVGPRQLRAAVQAHCRLRAGHRAEPVAFRCRFHRRRARFPSCHHVFVPSPWHAPEVFPKVMPFRARALGHTHPWRARTLVPSSRPSPPGALLPPRFAAGAHMPKHTTTEPNPYFPGRTYARTRVSERAHWRGHPM